MIIRLLVLFVAIVLPAYASTGKATLGQVVDISVTADGTQPLSYQWYKEGTLIPGATSATLTIPKADRNSAGNYSCYVSNDAGGIGSDAAVLTVTGLPPTIAKTSIGVRPATPQ